MRTFHPGRYASITVLAHLQPLSWLWSCPPTQMFPCSVLQFWLSFHLISFHLSSPRIPPSIAMDWYFDPLASQTPVHQAEARPAIAKIHRRRGQTRMGIIIEL